MNLCQLNPLSIDLYWSWFHSFLTVSVNKIEKKNQVRFAHLRKFSFYVSIRGKSVTRENPTQPFWRSVGDLSPRGFGFDPRSFRVSIVVYKGDTVTTLSLSQYFSFSPVIVSPPTLHTHSFIHHRGCVTNLNSWQRLKIKHLKKLTSDYRTGVLTTFLSVNVGWNDIELLYNLVSAILWDPVNIHFNFVLWHKSAGDVSCDERRGKIVRWFIYIKKFDVM